MRREEMNHGDHGEHGGMFSPRQARRTPTVAEPERSDSTSLPHFVDEQEGNITEGELRMSSGGGEKE
jgi:hypothetical protein